MVFQVKFSVCAIFYALSNCDDNAGNEEEEENDEDDDDDDDDDDDEDDDCIDQDDDGDVDVGNVDEVQDSFARSRKQSHRVDKQTAPSSPIV